MPELPEMQALSERLTDFVRGRVLERTEPLQFSALKTFDPPPDVLHGRVLQGFGRRGKFLVAGFGGPRLLVHLSQGGRVVFEDPAKTTKPKGAVLRMKLEGGRSVLVHEYGTERKAGWWVLAEGDDGPLRVLGPDPYDDAFGEWIVTGSDRRRLHTALRDQRTVAGIGRGYADDLLHRARLSPFASLSGLDEAQRTALLAAVREVLDEGLDAERRRSGGLPPKLGDHFAIHGHWGRPCPACGGDLRRVSYESHEVTYCPPCQTGGRVLADRRMSRIVK